MWSGNSLLHMAVHDRFHPVRRKKVRGRESAELTEQVIMTRRTWRTTLTFEVCVPVARGGLQHGIGHGDSRQHCKLEDQQQGGDGRAPPGLRPCLHGGHQAKVKGPARSCASAAWSG
jgi:hypothetical protein